MAKKSGDMLSLRKAMRKRKPVFIRHDANKKKRLAKLYRRPKGIQSKMRLNKRGYRRAISKGFKAPRAARALHHTGLSIAAVYGVRDLSSLKADTGVMIGRTVGKRNKLAIIAAAQQKGLTILNVKDPSSFQKAVQEELASKRKAKSDKKKEAEKKQAERKDKDKEAQKKDALLAEKEQKSTDKTIDEIAEEPDRKEAEKKEKDKLLTKKI